MGPVDRRDRVELHRPEPPDLGRDLARARPPGTRRVALVRDDVPPQRGDRHRSSRAQGRCARYSSRSERVTTPAGRPPVGDEDRVRAGGQRGDDLVDRRGGLDRRRAAAASRSRRPRGARPGSGRRGRGGRGPGASRSRPRASRARRRGRPGAARSSSGASRRSPRRPSGARRSSRVPGSPRPPRPSPGAAPRRSGSGRSRSMKPCSSIHLSSRNFERYERPESGSSASTRPSGPSRRATSIARPDRAAGRAARQQPLLAREPARGQERVAVGDLNPLVDLRRGRSSPARCPCRCPRRGTGGARSGPSRCRSSPPDRRRRSAPASPAP